MHSLSETLSNAILEPERLSAPPVTPVRFGLTEATSNAGELAADWANAVNEAVIASAVHRTARIICLNFPEYLTFRACDSLTATQARRLQCREAEISF
jgi:hypothetical protein